MFLRYIPKIDPFFYYLFINKPMVSVDNYNQYL